LRRFDVLKRFFASFTESVKRMILPGDDPKSIAAAAQCINAGGLLGLPTETVYGLAADADNDAAVAQIFQAKGRPADHPLIVHVAGIDAVAHFAVDVPEFAHALMQAFWPGPLTLILPRRPGIANAAAGGNPTIGLRCPAHPVALALLNWGQGTIKLQIESDLEKQLYPDPNYFGLAAPSANQFGRVSPTTARHVAGEFGDELLILDGGACRVGIESTIIDCTRGQPVLLRPGAITPGQVQAVCGLKVLLNEELQTLSVPAPKASGTLDSHYAPRASVRLMTAPELHAALEKNVSAEVFQSVALWSLREPQEGPGRIWRAMPADASCAAQQLFATLRDFDAQGVDQIWIEAPPESPEWDGVRDRLQRAAS
jgi:L-threonylcarbamoyladenylate synthase